MFQFATVPLCCSSLILLPSHSSFITQTLFSFPERKEVFCYANSLAVEFDTIVIISPPLSEVNILQTPALAYHHPLSCLWLMRGSHFICWIYQSFLLLVIAWPATIAVCSIYWLADHFCLLCPYSLLSVEAHWHFLWPVPTHRPFSKTTYILMKGTLISVRHVVYIAFGGNILRLMICFIW